jgi:hypothetical protein
LQVLMAAQVQVMTWPQDLALSTFLKSALASKN